MLKKNYENMPYFTRGADLIIDKRLCFQSHDDYFDCIDKQNTDSKINLLK